jgi:hypothetical protein
VVAFRRRQFAVLDPFQLVHLDFFHVQNHSHCQILAILDHRQRVHTQLDPFVELGHVQNVPFVELVHVQLDPFVDQLLAISPLDFLQIAHSLQIARYCPYQLKIVHSQHCFVPSSQHVDVCRHLPMIARGFLANVFEQPRCSNATQRYV